MKIKNDSKGFTLAEVMLVLGILIALSGIAFIALPYYQRLMAQIEYDSIAKEMFISAQNHLSMVENEGYLELTDFGDSDSETIGAYYYIVDNNNKTSKYHDKSLLSAMLPFGSIEETVRSNGSYIIIYDKQNAKILDVFYSKESDSRFGYDFTVSTYSSIKALRGNDKKSSRKNYDGKVIGWFGGEDVMTLPTRITAPIISIENKDELIVTVKNLDTSNSVRIIIKGKTSKEETYIDAAGGTFTYTLDTLKGTNGNFSKNEQFTGFIPGENLSIQAVAYNNSGYSNIAYSSEMITNSLFADGSFIENNASDTAYIAYFRHLENLDNSISGFDARTGITKAVQLTDLDWSKVTAPSVYNNKFLSVNILYKLKYDGKEHNIENLVVTGTTNTKNSETNGGVFAYIEGTKTNGVNDNSIENLRIVDLSFNSDVDNSNAGGLVGMATNTDLKNVYVYLSDGANYSRCVINGSSAGGLAGSISTSSVTSCFAAVKVYADGSSTGYAGGLIGSANSTTVSTSYSAGKTYLGKYNTTITGNNVNGLVSGGLVGVSTSSTINNCYSTCETYGSSISGGLIGDAGSSTTVSGKSYATGAVHGAASDDAKKGLFVGKANSGTSLSGWYLLLPNYVYNNNLQVVGGGTIANSNVNVSQIDYSLDNYTSFLGDYNVGNTSNSAHKAYAYDTTLKTKYKDTYPYYAVLNHEHYGDFPYYDIFAINN